MLNDGTVRAWGDNSFGVLGDGTTTRSSVPVQVTGLTGVKEISTLGAAAYALLTDGTVRAWGYNWHGRLGNGTTTDSSVPVQVSGLTGVKTLATSLYGTAYALLTDGTVRAWGNGTAGELGNGVAADSSVPVPVSGLAGVKELSATFSIGAFALLTDGTVRAWGSNNYGQLGNGTTTSSSVPVVVTGLGGITGLQQQV